MSDFRFEIKKKLEGSLARVGEIHTPHGIIHTPSFIVVGTKATVKALTPEQLKELEAEAVICNTYHLLLEPGDYRVKEAGGLHKIMNWNGPIMTDSGGFQVFSLGAAYGENISKLTSSTKQPLLLNESKEEIGPKIAKIDEQGVIFKSHLDGSMHYITPTRSIEIQHNLGADIIFSFDECTSPNEPFSYQREAMDRTHRWARESLNYHKSKENHKTQALFGIVQGGRFEELRKESARIIGEMEFDGFGIGGSFAKEDMREAVKWINEILPENKPRHLLGIGEPEDLFMAILNGCDTFDCVAPTRIGRNGQLYTGTGKINITNKIYRDLHEPIDVNCKCYTCAHYTKAYLAHLHRSKEILACTLSSIHNLYFIVNLVKQIRQSLIADNFIEFKNSFLEKYKNKNI